MDREMVLRGFSGRVSDLRSRMRLCHPYLSPKDDETELMLANNLDWAAGGNNLEPVDLDEALSFGTLWPEAGSTIRPGFGVAVAGEAFGVAVQDAIGPAGMDNLAFKWDDDVGCWTAIVRRSDLEQHAQYLANQVRAIFDEELQAALGPGKLSKKGAAALLVFRRTPQRRDTDVAIRELEAAHVEGDTDLYRRILAVQSVKLGVPQEQLHQIVQLSLSVRSFWFRRDATPKDRLLGGQTKSTGATSAKDVRTCVDQVLAATAGVLDDVAELVKDAAWRKGIGADIESYLDQADAATRRIRERLSK